MRLVEVDRKVQWILGCCVLMLSCFGIAFTAQADTFSMTGDMQLLQPSVGFNNPSR